MDHQLSATIEQLVVASGSTQTRTVRTFTAKPPKTAEQTLGRLFGIFDIPAASEVIDEFIDTIIEELKRFYYDVSVNPDQDLERRFELALQNLNQSVAVFIESSGDGLPLHKLHSTLGVIIQNQIVFSPIGSLPLYMFHPIRNNEFRIIDILDASQTPIIEPNPIKLFSQIVSGRLQFNDILVLASGNLLDYFSIERIKSETTAAESRTAAAEALLAASAIAAPVGVLFISLQRLAVSQPPAVIKNFNYADAASKDSMRELIRTENETQKLLTPSLLPELKKYAKVFSGSIAQLIAKVKITSGSKLKNVAAQRQRLRMPRISIPRPTLPKQISGLKNIGPITTPIKHSTRRVMSLVASQPIWNKIIQLAARLLGSLWSRFNALPRKSKTLLTVSVLLITVFVVSTILSSIASGRQEKINQFDAALTEAESIKNEAEASLIYRDENQARRLLLNAKNLLTAAEAPTDELAQRAVLLLATIDEQLVSLRHMVEISNPVQILNFANLDATATIADFMVSAGDTIYSQNAVNQSVYKGNVTTRQLAAILSPDAATGTFTNALLTDNGQILLLSSTQSLFNLNPTTDAVTAVPLTLSGSAAPAGIAMYANRLYLLDPASNQIIRYDPSGGGYGRPTEWVTDPTVDLSNAVDIAIDGLVYVLKQSGEVVVFERGKKITFNQAIVDPALSGATKLKTSVQSNFLYILDPQHSRIVVLSKEGQLVTQYTSPAFDDLKDFTVFENEKEMYVLAGSRVYGIPASHL